MIKQPCVSVILCLAMLAAWCPLLQSQGIDPAADAKIAVGQPAPVFEVTTLEGKTVGLSQLKGKVVLINFFATWCGPCLAEMPHLEKQIWQQYKDKNFSLLAIGREHTNAELVAFRKKMKLTLPLAGDPQRKVYGRYAKQYIPRNIVIDAQGKVVYQSVGYTSAEFAELIEVIRTELEKTISTQQPSKDKLLNSWQRDFQAFMDLRELLVKESMAADNGKPKIEDLEKVFLNKRVTWSGTLRHAIQARPSFEEAGVIIDDKTKLHVVKYYAKPQDASKWEALERGALLEYTGLIRAVHIDSSFTRKPFVYIELAECEPTGVHY